MDRLGPIETLAGEVTMMISKLPRQHVRSIRLCRPSGLVSWASLLGGLLGMSCAGKFDLGEVRSKLSDQPIVGVDQIGVRIVSGPEDADAKFADDFAREAGDLDGDGHADWISKEWTANAPDVVAYGGPRPRDGILRAAGYGAGILSDVASYNPVPVGDVDGDGKDDLALNSRVLVRASSDQHVPVWGSQRALLVYGASGRPAGDLISGAAAFTSPGLKAFPQDEVDSWVAEYGDYFGVQSLSFRALGDLDRDGYDDVALWHGMNLAAMTRDANPESGDGGLFQVESTVKRKEDSYVFYGGPQRFGADADANQPDARLSMAPTGDVDGDGFTDFASGFDELTSSAGTIRLVRGGPGRLSDESATINAVSVEFDEPQAQVDADGVGDIDDDGYDDLMVTAYPADGLRSNIYLFYGGPALLADTLYADFADAAFLSSVHSDVEGQEAEVDLQRLQDWNGDGISDLLLEYVIPTNLAGRRPKTEARVILGRPERYTGRFAMTFGEARQDHIAAGVRPIGDVDGDGLTDVEFRAAHGGEFLGTYVKFGSSSANIIH